MKQADITPTDIYPVQAQRLVVVLGAHRSGTSAITRALQVLGVPLGERLMPPVEGVNDKGFWEDLDFYGLNIQMLQALGRDWYHLAPLGDDMVASLCAQGFSSQAQALLHDKMGELPLFGFKDPRVTLLLPFWQRVFASCDVEVSYVLALRNPLSVAKSLTRREGFDVRKGALLWLTHVLSMMRGTAGLNRRVLVDYDQLIAAPQHEVRRIASQLDLTIDPTGLLEYETAFLDASLQHTRYSAKDLADADFKLAFLPELYDQLRRAASDVIGLDDLALCQTVTAACAEYAQQGKYLLLLDSMDGQWQGIKAKCTKPGAGEDALQTDAAPVDLSSLPGGNVRVHHMPSNFNRNNVSLLDDIPVVSIIILNFNKPYLTWLSVKSALESSISVTFEVIVVDNHSMPENFASLRERNLPVRLLRNAENHHFGEGNNIAADAARGEFLLFLNNDAFVAPNCVDALLQAFYAVPECGAAGPVFHYPDGTLQEAGAFILQNGHSAQRGKGSREFDLASIPDFEMVDYISAACLMIRASRFADLGGFSYRFDPAYYEDVDLCLRLKCRGESTVLAKAARCIHVENATKRDEMHAPDLDLVVQKNRLGFLDFWGGYLQARAPEAIPCASIPRRRLHTLDSPGELASAAILNGAISPGGALRYAMASAAALGQFGSAALATTRTVSSARMESLAFDLGLPPGGVRTVPIGALDSATLERAYVIGRGACPEFPPMAKRRFFHCLSLVPARPFGEASQPQPQTALEQCEKIFAPSRFAQQVLQDELQRIGIPRTVEMMRPAVAADHLLERARCPKPWILSIGAFTESHRSPRQDILIEAIKRTSASFRADWTLILCGTVPNRAEDRSYLERLQQDIGDDVHVKFVLSPSRSALESLMSQSSFYVDARGFGEQDPSGYWKCDSLGIALIEAMVAGCKALSYVKSCGAEIVDEFAAGATYGSMEELLAQLDQMDVGGLAIEQRQRLAKGFGEQQFRDRFLTALA